VKLTGERPMQGATPDSLLALHDAGYREVMRQLGTGVVVDVGCGVGDETVRLAGTGRRVVGVDYDGPTALAASRAHGRTVGGPRFAAMDGARLALRDGAADAVVSSHIIEHFVGPEAHVAELARVLRGSGTAFVITPNAPADFENPFHVHLFEAEQLRSLLGLFFGDVEVWGLEGDEVLKADFATRRARGHRLLRLDVLRLRRRMPRRWYVWLYERVLPLAYRVLGRSSGVGSGIDASHLFLTDRITPDTPVLVARARRPRPRVGSMP
jgi:SAM-dependent methyltransferase